MINCLIKKKIKCPYLMQNITNFLVYPQPFLDIKTKQEIYDKSKTIILKKCFVKDIDTLHNCDIEVVVYKEFHKIVDINFSNHVGAPWILHIYFDD